MIRSERLSKTYGNHRILDSIDLQIKKGEITIVTGPSGSGKSTLLRVASLIENPDSGIVTIDNEQFSFPQKTDKPIRHHFPKVGVVFQNLFLWPHLTNEGNLLLPLKNRLSSSQKTLLDELSHIFGITGFLSRYPNQCSLGQRQRIAIVRALLLDSDYYFFDEITSSLDIEQISILLTYLNVLKSKGKGIFLVTHFLKFAQKAADQIIFLDNGSVIETGTNEILTHPKTERLREFVTSLDNIII